MFLVSVNSIDSYGEIDFYVCCSKSMDETPVKTFTRVHLTPTTKEYVCIICGGNIQNKNYRMRLFNKETKTSHCNLLEKHLQVTVSKSVCTDHVCRQCVRKLTTVENKVSELKDMHRITMGRLQSSHGTNQRKDFQQILILPQKRHCFLQKHQYCIPEQIYSW